MAERKVLNKYYPPDFDPAKIPRKKQLKNLQMKVRMMLPMSIRCNTCGEYIYKGTKFNCRKEDVVGDTYLGIMKFRFYFKCTKCSSELVMKTDPQNSDYVMESGASRNFEPWRQVDEARDNAKLERAAEEMGDAMKALENKTLDSKQEMDIIATLDEMKSMRARQEKIGKTDALLALTKKMEEEQPSIDLTLDDEEILKSVVFKNSSKYIHRLDEEDLEDEAQVPTAKSSEADGKSQAAKRLKSTTELVKSETGKISGLIGVTEAPPPTKPLLPVFAVKKKGNDSSAPSTIGKNNLLQPSRAAQALEGSSSAAEKPDSAVLSSLAAYGDSEEDDE